MADYHEASRSNFFGVKDPEEFRRFCKRWHVEFVERDGKFALYTEGDRPWSDDEWSDYSGYAEANHGEGEGPDFLNELARQMRRERWR
jgi:hypothetical protein